MWHNILSRCVHDLIRISLLEKFKGYKVKKLAALSYLQSAISVAQRR